MPVIAFIEWYSAQGKLVRRCWRVTLRGRVFEHSDYDVAFSRALANV